MSTVPPPRIESTAAEKFFGLAARPFSLTPDLRFAYHSRSHTHALEQVTSALRRREGLIVVTGPIGTGKTMLCRSMLENFESRTFLSVILDPGLEVEDLLRQVLTDFGIMSGGAEASASGPLSEVTRHQFVSTLQQFLASLIPLQAHAVIMIDEAQRLNARVLEEIRLLSNFETDEAKLLQIVLVGQPDLDDLLRRPEMRQLNQRVARRCELYPLSEGEVGDYIERRLTVAASPEALAGEIEGTSASGSLVRFSPEAVRLVAQVSEGIPRVVNTLCDRALEAAYERQQRVIDADAVRTAAERLSLEAPGTVTLPGGRRLPWMRMAAAAAVVVGLAGGWWLSARDTESTSPAPSSPAAPPSSSSTPPPSTTSPAPSSAPSSSALSSASPSSTAGSSSPAAPAGSAAPSTAAAPASQSPAPAGSAAVSDRFQIAVAAFRTESRAAEVVDALSDLQIPAAVRPDATGAWQRVIAGPFASREAALAAQDALTRAGYEGTQIGTAP